MQEFFLTVILISLVTSVLILILSFGFSLLKSRVSPKVQYWTWVILFISLLIPFRPSFGIALIQIPQKASTSTQVIQETSQQLSQSKPDLWTSFLNLPWLEILLAIWLGGVLYQLTKHALAYYKFRQMVSRWGSDIQDLHILEHFFEMKERLGIKQDMTLIHYPAGHSPMMTGIKHLKVLLPETNYTDEELELIFEHELTHFLHRDIYVNMLGILVTSLYWFNPIVAFGYKEIQEAGEIYCDYAVLQQRDQHYCAFYGETIITMIDQNQKHPVALTTCFYSNKFSLKRRITAIMSNRLPKRLLSLSLLVMIPLLLLLSGSIFAFTRQQAEPVNSKQVKAGLSQENAVDKALASSGTTREQARDIKVTDVKNHYQVEFQTETERFVAQVSKTDGAILNLAKTSLSSTQATSSPQESSTASEEGNSVSETAPSATPASPAAEATPAPTPVTPTAPATTTQSTPAPAATTQPAPAPVTDDDDDGADDWDD